MRVDIKNGTVYRTVSSIAELNSEYERLSLTPGARIIYRDASKGEFKVLISPVVFVYSVR